MVVKKRLKKAIKVGFFSRQEKSDTRGNKNREEMKMARRGENIYKRKDRRYEGRYVRGKTLGGKTKFGYVMPTAIHRYVYCCSRKSWTA